MASIIDVAERAGVSPSTVSNVFNNPARVRKATLERVQAAAAELQFHPNLAARSLRSGSSPLVAIIVSDSQDAYVGWVIRSAQEALADRGRLPVVVSTDASGTRLRQSIEELRSAGINSFLLSPVPDEYSAETLRYLRGLPDDGVNIVVISNQMGGEAIDQVTTGATDGARQMVAHLVDLGHRRIAYVGLNAGLDGVGGLRLSGYLKGLQEFGLDRRDEWIVGGQLGVEAGLTALPQLWRLDERPTAILTADDSIAAGIVAACHRTGIRVPADLSVTGFNDEPIAQQLFPPLTSLAFAGTELGRVAVELLGERLDNSSRSESRSRHVEFELIVRESSGPAPS